MTTIAGPGGRGGGSRMAKARYFCSLRFLFLTILLINVLVMLSVILRAQSSTETQQQQDQHQERLQQQHQDLKQQLQQQEQIAQQQHQQRLEEQPLKLQQEQLQQEPLQQQQKEQKFHQQLHQQDQQEQQQQQLQQQKHQLQQQKQQQRDQQKSEKKDTNLPVLQKHKEQPTRTEQERLLLGRKSLIGHVDHSGEVSERSVCGYRTTAYLFNTSISLNQEPFLSYARRMRCIGNGTTAVFEKKFVVFRNAIVNPSFGISRRKGGEKMEDVWGTNEVDEYFQLAPGYFQIPCTNVPRFTFEYNDHLINWAKSLQCYSKSVKAVTIHDFTIAIQRYEYVNLYHTMTDFYNAFVVMLMTGARPSRVNILFVDTHPSGDLDPVWSTLFGKVTRAGHLPSPTLFTTLAWGMLGYNSPLNVHSLPRVPYLEEFRTFFLSQHNVSMSHRLNCAKPNVVLIWRHDYVAHPRNRNGKVVRKFANEDEMVAQVQLTLGSNAKVTGSQLDQLNMREQLLLVSQTDILIGMHGAGLSHILFLPNTSAVFELKPTYSEPSLTHFEAMARWRLLPYSIWSNTEAKYELSSYRTQIPPEVLNEHVRKLYQIICRNSAIRSR